MIVRTSCSKHQNLRRAMALIILVIFIVIAGSIGVTLAILSSTELGFGRQNYNVEVAFYATDSGVGRSKKILNDCPGWNPDPAVCDDSGCPVDYCSVLGPPRCPQGCSGNDSCCLDQDDSGDWYFEERYHIPPDGGAGAYYRIYVDKVVGEGVTLSVNGGKWRALP